MAHMQQQVLELVQQLLIDGATDAGSRVEIDRVDNLPAGFNPTILVEESPDGELIQPATISDVQQRTLNVQIRCVRQGVTANSGEDARAFGLQAEKALRTPAAIAAIAALCRGGYAIASSRLEMSAEGATPHVARVQDWTFTYFTRRATPDQRA